MLAIQSSGMPTLLQGRMPTLLQGPMPTLLGDANFDVLTQFRALLQANPGATVFISKSSTGSASGSTDDVTFVVIPVAMFGAVNQALMAAGNVAIQPQPLTAAEQFVPDAGSRFGTVASLGPIVDSGVNTLANGLGMSTKTKVIIGVGAIAVIGGVALIAFGKTHTHKSLSGARRRWRRR